MSEENKDLGDKAEDAFDDAKESAKKAAEDAKEAASDFGEEAKKTASEFAEGAKEAFSGGGGDNKKMLAGILGILFGSFGVHKFILGYNKEGIIMAAITLVGYATTCLVIGAFFFWIPGVIGFIEGIIYLTKSDEDFYNTYQVGKKPWF